MLRCFQSVRRESNLDMAIGGYRLVRTVTCFPPFKLIDVLADQVTFDSVTGDKGQGLLENFEFRGEAWCRLIAFRSGSFLSGASPVNQPRERPRNAENHIVRRKIAFSAVSLAYAALASAL